MERIAVVTDSSCSLSSAELERLEIRVVDIAVLADGVLIAGNQELLEAFAAKKQVSTAAPGVGIFENLYRDLLAQGFTHIFSLHMTSKLSSTFQNAQVAAQNVGPQVSVFDTRTAGFAQGRFVLEIATWAQEGRSRAEIWNRIENYRVPDAFLVPQTMEHLKQGGRVKAGAAMVAQLFQIIPVGRIVDGRLLYFGRAKTFEAALNLVVTKVILQDSFSRQMVVQTDDGQPSQAVEALEGLGPLTYRPLPPVLLAHTGPGAIALMVEE